MMIFYLIAVVLSLFCIAEALTGVNPGPPGFMYIAAGPNDPPPCKTAPGATYCEEVDNYPLEQILYALSNSKIDVSKFLVDETFDEAPNFKTDGSDASLLPTLEKNRRPGEWNFNETLYTPRPPHPYRPQSGDTTLQDGTFWTIPNAQTPARFGRLPRTVLEDYPNISEDSLRMVGEKRLKRKAENELIDPACRSRLKYVFPKVAKRIREGDWLYLINLPLVTMTQMIRTEVCNPDVEGKPCMNGNCNVPLGYRSVCEQHYLQKRLVTLAPEGGTNIFMDMFWIPTCCVCKTYLEEQN